MKNQKSILMNLKKIALFVLIASFYNCKQKTSESESTAEMAEKVMETKEAIGIHPIEHATFVLTYKDAVIYVDPVGGAEAFKGKPKPNLAIVTDIHGDHFNLETLQALNVPLVAPQAVVDQIPKSAKINSLVINNGETKNMNVSGTDINIEAIPMYNLREEALKFHTKGRGNGYVLTLGDKRVYISGDTEDIPEMRNLKNIDMAFVCMNLPYTMPVDAAASAVLDFKPKKVYPYHYRGTGGLSDIAKFKKLVNDGDPNIEVVQLNWYPNN